MDVLTKALEALWQVLLVGLLLGAGLPALFALGLRSLNAGRVEVGVAAAGEGSQRGATKPTALGLTGAIACFAVLVAAVLFGIVVIVFGSKIFG